MKTRDVRRKEAYKAKAKAKAKAAERRRRSGGFDGWETASRLATSSRLDEAAAYEAASSSYKEED